MSLHLILHFLIIPFVFYVGYVVFQRYRRTNGFFFLYFCIALLLWFSLYTIMFTIDYNQEILLYFSRFMFFLSFTGMYSFLFFILFFGSHIPGNKYKKKIYISYFLLFIFTVFTPFIIEDMVYIEKMGRYLEEYGTWYFIFLIGYILYIPLLFFSYLKIVNKQSTINKVRLKYMTIGFLFFVILSILFLVILPYFGYYYSEKNIVIFLVPFILSVFYSVRKYFFSNILFGFGKLVVFGWSLFLSIVLLYIIKHYYISLGLTLTNFWGINQGFGIFDFSLGVVMFIAFYKLLERELLSNPFSLELVQNFEGLKRKLIYINSFEALNNILQKELCFLLKIKYTYINTGLSNQQDLVDFFEQDISNSMFINDIVFIQENKHKTQLETVRKNISEDIYIVLPLYENKTIIGFFELGKKSFADHYSSEEIDIIRDFVLALERHIKYIKTYNIINDLSFNLDKKVDEKTIEYNNLLNKQKEFIAILSHEIKGPVANAILQLECLLDDLKDCDIPKSNIISELDIVNQQFLKVGELTKNLFSVQSYDINKIELFKEKVNIKDFIITEFEVFESLYPDICFKLEMEGKLEYIDLDRVQMKQVIDNLLNNAVKFTTANDAQIHVLLVAKGKNIYLEIEDNGIGFKEVDISQIFEKYTTKGGSSVGLGMGLYLCKRIVEMHSGQITASRSLDLGGAKFQIKLPM